MEINRISYETFQDQIRIGNQRYFIFGYENNKVVAIFNLTNLNDKSESILNSVLHDCTNGLGRTFTNAYGRLRYTGTHEPVDIEGLDKDIIDSLYDKRGLDEDSDKVLVECSVLCYPEKIIYIDGHSFCSIDCVIQNYTPCQSCGRLDKNSEMVFGPSGFSICKACAEDTFTCCNCGNTCWFDDYYGNGECFACNRDEYDDDDDHDDDCDRHGPIHSYSWKPYPVFHGKPSKDDKKTLYFGIENELECPYDPDETADDFISECGIDESDLYLKSDGSIDNGFEIVSHPRTIESWQKFDLKSKLDWLINMNCKSHSTTTCGLHVHFSGNYMSKAHKLKMGMFFWNNFELIQKFSRRKYTTYCKPKPNLDKKLLTTTSDDRYEAINWTDRKAPEIRIFRGSLKSDTVLAAIEFTHALIIFTGLYNTVSIAKKTVTWDMFTVWVTKQPYIALSAYLEKRNLANLTRELVSVSNTEA